MIVYSATARLVALALKNYGDGEVYRAWRLVVQYTTSDIIVTTCEMVAVVHRRPCLQHLAYCSVNSRHIGLESRFLPTPPAFDAPVKGFPSEYRHPIWYGKNKNGVATRWLKNFEDMFIRFDMIHERDGQTDRQTPHDA